MGGRVVEREERERREGGSGVEREMEKEPWRNGEVEDLGGF